MKNHDNLTMKELPLSERPYELLRDKGAASLTDAQLLSVFLQNGLPGESVLSLSTRILAECTDRGEGDPLTVLFSQTPERMQEFAGIGPIKALQLCAVKELSVRLSSRGARRRAHVKDAASIADIYMEEMRGLKQEIVKVIYLNTKNAIVFDRTVSMGCINRSLLSPREVFGPALEKGATRVIMLHNHPSGDPFPSDQDLELTERMLSCGLLLDIPLLDHIIIGDQVHYSLHDSGVI